MGIKHILKVMKELKSGEFRSQSYLRDGLKMELGTLKEVLGFLLKDKKIIKKKVKGITKYGLKNE